MGSIKVGISFLTNKKVSIKVEMPILSNKKVSIKVGIHFLNKKGFHKSWDTFFK